MNSAPESAEIQAALVQIEVGTARLVKTASGLEEVDLLGPSLLPGWTRAHVLAHVARNASALVNLLTSAATGTETPMYPSIEVRNAAIEAGAQGSGHQLVGEIVESAALFSDAARALPTRLWDSEVTWMSGVRRPVSSALTGRLREVELHHVDLDAGYTAAHWDPAFVAGQLGEAAATLATRWADRPEVVLVSTDREIPPAAVGVVSADPGPPEPEQPEWRLPGTEPSVTVSGPSAALLAWVCGRSTGDGLAATDGKLPDLPSWP